MMSHTSALNPLIQSLFQFEYRKGDIRKAHIIEAAIRCLTSYGLEKTTYELIGKEAKIKRSHVAYYFSSKEEIIEACVKYMTATAQALTVEKVKVASTPRDKILGVVEGAFAWVQKYPLHAKGFMAFYHLATYLPEYQKLNSEIRELGAQRLTVLVQRAFPRMESQESFRLAKEIQIFITGAITEFVSSENLFDVEETRDQTKESVLKLIQVMSIKKRSGCSKRF